MNKLQITALIAGYLALLVLGLSMPLLVLISLNTLFPVLSLAYTFGNYLSVMVIGVFIRGLRTTTKGD